MSTVPLRRVAAINPQAPNFDRLDPADEVTFMPLETVWPAGRANTSRRALKSDVANGYTRFHTGDILVPKITPTFEAGRTCVAYIETPAGAASTEVHVVRALLADPQFLAYTFQSQQFLTEGACNLEGVGNLRRIPSDWLSDYPVWNVPLPVQTAVVDFLDRETAKRRADRQTGTARHHPPRTPIHTRC